MTDLYVIAHIAGTVITVPPPDRPLYAQVADDLRRRIASGDLPPGALLPSEADLMAQYGASRGTVREAVARLRAEGLVVTAHGRGTQVRLPGVVRRLAADRYRPATQTTPFGADHRAGLDYTMDCTFTEVGADPAVAALFEVEPGTPLLGRRFVFRTGGVAQQMSVSSLRMSDVAGTPVMDPDREPWPGGTIAQMASLGLTVAHVDEEIGARMPTEVEAETLLIPAGVPVLTITRQMRTADGRVVEVAHDIVIPADRVRLAYRIDLT